MMWARFTYKKEVYNRKRWTRKIMSRATKIFQTKQQKIFMTPALFKMKLSTANIHDRSTPNLPQPLEAP